MKRRHPIPPFPPQGEGGIRTEPAGHDALGIERSAQPRAGGDLDGGFVAQGSSTSSRTPVFGEDRPKREATMSGYGEPSSAGRCGFVVGGGARSTSYWWCRRRRGRRRRRGLPARSAAPRWCVSMKRRCGRPGRRRLLPGRTLRALAGGMGSRARPQRLGLCVVWATARRGRGRFPAPGQQASGPQSAAPLTAGRLDENTWMLRPREAAQPGMLLSANARPNGSQLEGLGPGAVSPWRGSRRMALAGEEPSTWHGPRRKRETA